MTIEITLTLPEKLIEARSPFRNARINELWKKLS